MRKKSTPPCIGLPLLCTGLLALLVVQCADSQTDGRAWVAGGHSEKLILLPDGVLHIDRSFHRSVKGNYRGYIGLVSKAFKDKHLFNQNAVPLVVYFMTDAEQFAKYCSVAPEGKGAFVPEERSIYLHAGGNQLVDGGVGKSLIRDITRAVMYDMYHGECPPWMDVGVSNLFADGSFGPKDDSKDKAGFDWFLGLPDPEQWKPLLGGDLPSFEDVRTASREELAKLGPKGAAVATAAVYLLKELEQLRNVIWRIRPEVLKERDAEAVLGAIKFFDPRYAAHFGNPVETMFKLRPDYRVYLESALAAQSADLSRVHKNATDNRTVGGYWWQYANLQMLAGKEPEAVESLETCCKCDPHRDHPAALAALARIYYEQKNWAKLKPVTLQQLTTLVLPTPTMHLMLAESVREADVDGARASVRAGLGLPARGFESDVARLKELADELN